MVRTLDICSIATHQLVESSCMIYNTFTHSLTSLLFQKFKESIASQKDVAEPDASSVEPPLESIVSISTTTIPHGDDDDDNDEEFMIDSEDPTTPPQPATIPTTTTTTTPGSSILRECAVCLEAFCDNDDICTSNNPDCPHVFHRSCMHSWLMRQEECPCCRRPYLQFDPLEEIMI